ncbi:superfamily I DNA/RNA helicase [Catenuloplanes nepalensis]|uniref:Superfamily I DNA/RNA helicase n=1 Tax=Catenuloplanes nepalensis TaxID=587533 RepID=A0ABT9N6P8_9ACTN|nr:hypothetical protein [Catenuloplanes nepalensis]MDP9799372.1 superfamily I DNA/RNA helicase [Catenuloplanes nepalensis]
MSHQPTPEQAAVLEQFGTSRADLTIEAGAGTGKKQDADVVVSTAHRAKGREWREVQIGADFREPRPDPYGRHRLPADELMLGYVAVTRAQTRLHRSGLEWVDDYATAPRREISEAASWALPEQTGAPRA